MKNFRPLILLFVIVWALASSASAQAPVNCSLLQVNNSAAVRAGNMNYWFGVMELPFLFIAVLFAFLTAYALRGGKFGKGMAYVAWGMGFYPICKASKGA